MTWPAFLVMGDYAFYVWGSFGLMLVAIGGEVMLLLRRRRAGRDSRDAASDRHSRRVRI
jgi:heme exporter protein CcmD